AGRVVALERPSGTIEVRDISGAVLMTFPGTRPELSGSGRFLLSGGTAIHDLQRKQVYPVPGTLVGEARWSPRRDAVALTLSIGGETDVYLFTLDGAEPRLHRLTKGGGGAPRWVGRGRLVYQAPRASGGFGLFVRDAGGLGPERPFWDEAPDVDATPRPAAQA
ncbi:MAG TPA: hypothetical protein VHF22_04355, partial [Planctomycetota bacterium]|nr:hypothetical protein [Planctomycetota bacterium]